mmetsp:Transcript_78234/g.247233  ORF Transcript_78234/g.247233 Transcript_78234/m.247233 type:complete len:208 (+) Transcript_78234:581-1204(+)
MSGVRPSEPCTLTLLPTVCSSQRSHTRPSTRSCCCRTGAPTTCSRSSSPAVSSRSGGFCTSSSGASFSGSLQWPELPRPTLTGRSTLIPSICMGKKRRLPNPSTRSQPSGKWIPSTILPNFTRKPFLLSKSSIAGELRNLMPALFDRSWVLSTMYCSSSSSNSAFDNASVVFSSSGMRGRRHGRACGAGRHAATTGGGWCRGVRRGP